MPQPTLHDEHIDAPLSNILVAYLQGDDDFIFDKVFPRVPVLKKSDYYYSYKKGNWFRTSAQKRAPGTESAGTGYEIDKSNSYHCDVWAIHKDVPWDSYANADTPLNPRRTAVKFVGRQLKLRAEKEFVTHYFTNNIWTGSTTGVDITPSTLWNAGGSTPIQDIREQRTAIKRRTGYRPNVLVVGPEVYDALVDHPDIVNRIKYTQRGIVTKDILASIFDVEKFLIAEAIENAAAEGQTDTLDFMYGKNALLVYSAQAPAIEEPSGGYVFTWTGLENGGDRGANIATIPAPLLKSDRIEAETAFDMKLVGSDLGAFFTNVIG